MNSTEKDITTTGEYRRAYAAAIPDQMRFFDRAAAELVVERWPDTGIITDNERNEIRQNPSLILERAEHLSRHEQAWEATVGRRNAAIAAQNQVEAATCPVCQELMPPVMLHWLSLVNGSQVHIVCCGACADVAREQLAVGFRTKSREARVANALKSLVHADS